MINHNKKEIPIVASARGIAAMSIALILSVLATGCSRPQDVTKDPGYGNFEGVVGVWKSKVPLSLREMNGRMYLVSTNVFMQTSQERLLAPAGSEIHVEHLILYPSWECNVIEINGSLTAGPYAGKTLILDARLFSGNRWFRGPSSSTNWSVDPDMLEGP